MGLKYHCSHNNRYFKMEINCIQILKLKDLFSVIIIMKIEDVIQFKMVKVCRFNYKFLISTFENFNDFLHAKNI